MNKKFFKLTKYFIQNCIKFADYYFIKTILFSCWKKMNFTIIFIVALDMFVSNYTPLFIPFDRAALALTNSTVIQASLNTEDKNIYNGLRWRELENFAHPNAPILLTIEEETFDKEYGGISPIDRCKLAESIGQVLETNPKILFIDFDLSPLQYSNDLLEESLSKEVVNSQYPKNNYQYCQKKLETILYKNSDHIVLIEPFQNTPAILNWKEKLENSGVHFASSQINASLGNVIASAINSHSVAKTVYSKVYPEQKASFKEENSRNASPINYIGLGNFTDKKFNQSDTFKDNQVIFLGGSYGIDDHHITPIGENTPGIMIQAYDYGTLLKPITTNFWTQLFAFVFELIIGFTVMFVFRKLWDYYLDLETSNNVLKTEVSIFISIFIYLVAAGMAFFSLYLAGWLMQGKLLGYQLWISPVPIVLTIFVYSTKDILLEKIKNLSSNKANPYKRISIDNNEEKEFPFLINEIKNLSKTMFMPIRRSVTFLISKLCRFINKEVLVCLVCFVKFVKIVLGLIIVYGAFFN